MTARETETVRSPKVWIVNNAGHDYSNAERFGVLDSLTRGNVNPTYIDRMTWQLARGIAKFAFSDDFLLISGTPVLNALALSLWLTRFGTVNLLVYDAKKQIYVKSRVATADLQRILESST